MSEPKENMTKATDADAPGKAESVLHGNVEVMERPFSVLSLMGISVTTTNTAVGVMLTIGTCMPYGGPILFVYGFIFMALVGLASATTLAELASAMPDPGGQYIWVAMLAPARSRRFLSYITGIFSWAGAVCTGASACLAGPQLLFSLVQLIDPTFEYRPWMGFLGFQAVNLACLIPSLFEKALPKVSRVLLMYIFVVFLAVFISLFAAGGDHQSAKAVFTYHNNTSSWGDGVAFFIGLNGSNWSFSCLDAIVHVADEIPNPRKNVPKALMWSIAVGFVMGAAITLALLFNIADFDAEYSTLTIIYNKFGDSKAAAIAFQTILFVATIEAMWGIHVWQSRLAWTIGLNKGFPFSRHLGHVFGAPFHTPLWALLFSASFTSILGCLYLASETAFNSLISSGILFQYLSMAIPTILLLWRGRSTLQHGPFWYPKLGLVANITMIAWASVALVFYCFPYGLPIVMDEMNFVSAVLAVVLILSITLWFTYGKKRFTYPELGSSHYHETDEDLD